MPDQNPTFQEFLIAKAKGIYDRSKKGEDARTCVSVSMVRRQRADTLSDRFGFFSPHGTNQWLDQTTSRDPEAALKAMNAMKFMPIIRKAVSANLAAMVTGAVKVTAEPAVKDPTAGGVAAVAKGVFDYLDGNADFWSRRVESQCAGLGQVGYGFFIRSRHNPLKTGETVTETEWGEQPMQFPGEYACAHCGGGGAFFDAVTRDESGSPVTVCPECDGEAEVLEEPMEEPIPAPSGERTRNTGDAEMSVHPHYEIRIDDDETANGNLRAAQWFEYHHLVRGERLQQENPGIDLGTPAAWSFPLKWLHALKSGSTEMVSQFDAKCNIFEVREISLLPAEYAGHREPMDGGFVLRGGDGQPLMRRDERTGEMVEVFRIKPGERLIDKFPRGFRFKLKGDDMVLPGTAEDPGVAEYDFRNEWSYGGFTPDPLCFWNSPLIELLQLQEDINTLYTIDFQHRERAAKTNLVYDSQMFDADAFDYDYVPSNAGALEPNDDINKHWGVVEAPAMQQALQGLQFLFDIAPQVGAPPPVALGASDPSDDTYGGQRLKHQRSLMLLSAYGQSKAEAKVSAFKQLLKIAQKHWPDERFQYLRSRLGEEWREADIEAFREADFDRVLNISYVEGSEVPTTLMEREQKMGAILVQLFEAIPALAQAGKYEPDLRNLISRYMEMGGIDYDFGDAEGDRRLAEARYGYIRDELEEMRAQGVEPTPDDLFVLMSHPMLTPLLKEDVSINVEFWTDKARALLARRGETDVSFVACCDEMIARHEGAAVTEAQGQVQDQVNAEAPLRAEEEARAAADAEAQAAAAEAEEGRAREQRDADERGKDEDRKHQVSVKAMELASRERQAAARPQARA